MNLNNTEVANTDKSQKKDPYLYRDRDHDRDLDLMLI
jgi:hypothetical protein